MIPDFSGDFISFKSTEDGDACVIIDEGKVEFNESLKKDMFNILVCINGLEKHKVFSPNNKHGQALQKAFGLDTKDWVGKKFTIIHVDDKMHIKPILK